MRTIMRARPEHSGLLQAAGVPNRIVVHQHVTARVVGIQIDGVFKAHIENDVVRDGLQRIVPFVGGAICVVVVHDNGFASAFDGVVGYGVFTRVVDAHTASLGELEVAIKYFKAVFSIANARRNRVVTGINFLACVTLPPRPPSTGARTTGPTAPIVRGG